MFCCLFLYAYLPTKRLVHVFTDDSVVAVHRLEVHQFGYRTFHRTVVSAHNTGILELKAGVITVHLHTA